MEAVAPSGRERLGGAAESAVARRERKREGKTCSSGRAAGRTSRLRTRGRASSRASMSDEYLRLDPTAGPALGAAASTCAPARERHNLRGWAGQERTAPAGGERAGGRLRIRAGLSRGRRRGAGAQARLGERALLLERRGCDVGVEPEPGGRLRLRLRGLRLRRGCHRQEVLRRSGGPRGGREGVVVGRALRSKEPALPISPEAPPPLPASILAVIICARVCGAVRPSCCIFARTPRAKANGGRDVPSLPRKLSFLGRTSSAVTILQRRQSPSPLAACSDRMFLFVSIFRQMEHENSPNPPPHTTVYRAAADTASESLKG